MTVCPLSDSDALPREARTLLSFLLVSLFTSELVLLISACASQGALPALALLSALLAASGSGYGLAKAVMLRRRDALARIYAGLLTTAGGLLMTLIALHTPRNGWLLLAGVAVAGLGQGMAGYTVSHRRQAKHARGRWLAGMALTGVIVFLINQSGGLINTIALLTDLALLGALYCKINPQAE
ncbi:hypothetical protein ACN6UZ_002241 [Cronobacter dublinensis]